ncbi:MAG: carboxypeptidase regulatory-like domain-containing protein [Gemmatimonadetes bacterium]|nr:carboxypeptidase regulatory-like domain-containing protein [Gemmatimonadota bacterium]
MPVTGRPAQPVTTDGSAPWVLVRPATTSLGEEGAEVTTDELRAPVLPATISGVLRDSTGKRALAGAVVRIGGATRTVVPDSAGRFKIDALAPGPIALLATSASYDSLGIAAADLSLELASGEVRRIALTAARCAGPRRCGSAMARRRPLDMGRCTSSCATRRAAHRSRCGGDAAMDERRRRRAAGDPVAVEKEATSDARGMLAVCAVPSEREATLRVTPAKGGAAVTRVLVIRAREVHHVEVRLAPSPPTE